MPKLTADTKAQIVARKGEKTTKGLAEEFGLSQSTIRKVLRQAAKAESYEAEQDEVVLETVPESDEARGATPVLRTVTLYDTTDGFDTGSTGDRAEHVITDDDAELKGFHDEWASGASSEVAPEPEEPVRPTKADEKKLRALEAAEARVIEEALRGEAPMRHPEPLSQADVNGIETDVELRSKYLSRIYLNVTNFRELLPFIKDKDAFLQSLHKKSTRELISLSGLIETQRSLGNVAAQMKNAFFIAARGTEYGCTRLGMRVEGFAEDLRQKERELEMIFQEIAVEQADSLKSYTTPQMRLAMIFTSSLMLCDSRNRMLASQKKPAPSGLQQAYSDL